MANQDNEMVPCRKPILIHLPIRKLRETCLWKLGLHLYKNGTTSVERFDNILPGTVKKDLHYVINVIVQNSLHS